jgi:hypothetical protein
MYTGIPGVGPGITLGCATLFEARDVGDPGVTNFLGLMICLPRSNFYYMSVIITGVKLIKLLQIKKS